MFGEEVKNWVDYFMIRLFINCVVVIYDLVYDLEYVDLMIVILNIIGEKINRFGYFY